MEKAYRDRKVVIQDNESNKLYAFYYIDSNYIDFEESNSPIFIAKEVFPKQVTITVYE